MGTTWLQEDEQARGRKVRLATSLATASLHSALVEQTFQRGELPPRDAALSGHPPPGDAAAAGPRHGNPGAARVVPACWPAAAPCRRAHKQRAAVQGLPQGRRPTLLATHLACLLVWAYSLSIRNGTCDTDPQETAWGWGEQREGGQGTRGRRGVRSSYCTQNGSGGG